MTTYLNWKPRFNGVLPRHNLPRIKDRVHVINLDDEQGKGTH